MRRPARVLDRGPCAGAISHTHPCRTGTVCRLGSRFGSNHGAQALEVFKSIPDSGLTVVAACAFITSACLVTQDHPVYIPQLLSAVTGRAGGR